MELSRQQKEQINGLLKEGTQEWHVLEKDLIYQALFHKYKEEADICIEEAIGARTEKIWREIREICGSNHMSDFLSLLFDPLPGAGWEFTVEEEEGQVKYCITKCPKYEMARELGVEKLFYLLNCATDYYSAKGFNPDIRFTRTKTLMEGDGCCNHTYEMIKCEREVENCG